MQINNITIKTTYALLISKLPERVEIIRKTLEKDNKSELLTLILQNYGANKRLELLLYGYSPASMYIDAKFFYKNTDDITHSYQGYFDVTDSKIDQYIEWLLD